MDEMIMVVNEMDEELGFDEKLKVHKEGTLHRAFSAILVDTNGRMLIQRRARSKYHSGGLLSNSFCSHFRKGESVETAINRASKDELGISISEYDEIGKFTYKVKLGDLSEHEIDHVFIVKTDQKILPNPDEVEDFQWVDIAACQKDLLDSKEAYTYWFRMIMQNETILNRIMEKANE
ncbi:MAG: isopentenyl-diphosphate Delta-isomerase [Eubacterium sp.]|nr:isopentenyl-diphosphate Delta-isomerase [Eubacterium sp.]